MSIQHEHDGDVKSFEDVEGSVYLIAGKNGGFTSTYVTALIYNRKLELLTGLV